jgi:hypothetical protein
MWAFTRLGYEVFRAGYVTEPNPHNQSLDRAGRAFSLAHEPGNLSAPPFGAAGFRGILRWSGLIPGLREKSFDVTSHGS